MSDIVERLRHAEQVGSITPDEWDVLAIDAADEIERLEAEVARAGLREAFRAGFWTGSTGPDRVLEAAIASAEQEAWENWNGTRAEGEAK